MIRIGSAADNDLVFDKPMVSGHHAWIERDGDVLQITDLGSTNGTYVNGERLGAGARPVEVGDEIGLGSFAFELEEAHIRLLKPASAIRTLTETIDGNALGDRGGNLTSTLEADKPSLEELSLTIGYHPEHEITIEAPQVSGTHARVTRRPDASFWIEDLGSTNGTFVGGIAVDEPTRVDVDSNIGLGSYELPFSEVLEHFVEADRKHHQGQITTREPRETPVGTSSQVATLAIDVGDMWQHPRESELTIGRADDNDIVIPAPQVSGYHAILRPDGEGRWKLLDRGSLNGTYVNVRSTPLNPHTEVPVTTEDVLFLGSYRFPMSRLADYLRDHGEGEAIQIPQDKDVITIGRGEDNDIVIQAAQVSRHHARLERKGDNWLLVDLGSANGTYVDGTRVTRCRISPEHQIAFGSYQLRLDPNAGVAHTGYQGEIMLRAEAISVDVKDGRDTKRLLDSISFTAYPTEFIGIMGPSGAGKTTLLMALNGYLAPTSGQSLINNLDVYQNYNQFRGNIGYVPQDDIIHRELTVYESLYYTAKLRLPPDTSDTEIERLIDKILDDLGILEAKHVLIGSPLKKGISGGQRKRVNLAQELITQPSLLFLDEPTSGLASSDTRSVMQLLRRLADEGRTILLTIHQPSLDAYKEMDNVLYLARGKLVYYGPTYPDSILHFNPGVEPGTPDGDKMLSNPDHAMGPLAEDNAASDSIERIELRREQYEDSKYYQDYVDGRRDVEDNVKITSSKKQRPDRMLSWRQWWILTRRTLNIKRKDLANTAILLLQAPIIAALISIVFNLKSDPGPSPVEQFITNQNSEGIDAAALFMLTASAVWFGCSNSAREIVGELAILRRERMVNLKIPSYVLSKYAVLALLSLVQCSVLLGITYPLIGFYGDFTPMLLTLFLCSTAGLGMGLFLSAIVRSTEAAVALVPLLLIPQVVLGGLIVPIHNLDGGVRTAVRMASNGMASRWAFEGLLHAEQEARPKPPDIDVTDEERELAAKFELTPQNPRRQLSFGGVPLPDRERTRQLEALFKTRLAQSLNASQKEQSIVDRYFGSFARGFWRIIGILALFNVVLIVAVCGLLWFKDRDT